MAINYNYLDFAVEEADNIAVAAAAAAADCNKHSVEVEGLGYKTHCYHLADTAVVDFYNPFQI